LGSGQWHVGEPIWGQVWGHVYPMVAFARRFEEMHLI
jgi:hypothetical protein